MKPEHSAEYVRGEPRRFRAISIVPGNVIVECLVCDCRFLGITAHDVVEAFRAHRHAQSDGDPRG